MNEAYDNEAAKIGARSFTRTWRTKLAMTFVAAVIVGAGVAWLV